MNRTFFNTVFSIFILGTGIIFSQTSTRLITLGTGNPYPSATQHGPSAAVVYNNRVLLFDAGSGVMRQINGAHLPISGPEATFITHLHSDHTL